MSEVDNLPLFVLPMVLMPGEIQSLRIFEPRYRQMLDDCLLDDRPFGMVMTDSMAIHNGWSGPRMFGCEAEIISHETKGSNHFIEFVGRRRFQINKVHDPILPPFEDELTTFQQTELKNTLNGILSKIGGILQIDKETLDDWIEDRTDMVIDDSSTSMFAVAALTISDPEYKYQLLSCADSKEVFLQLTRFLAEMDV